MTIAVWVLEILVALAFLAAGVSKLTINDKGRARMPWTADYADSTVRLIGGAELLGAIGLVAPRSSGILPWLTPLAAIGLALVMALAIPVHARRHETPGVITNVTLGTLAILVALGTIAVG